MKTRILALALAFIVVSLAGCNESNNGTELTPVENENNDDKFVGISDVLIAQKFNFTIDYVTEYTSVSNELGVEYTSDDGELLLLIMFTAKNTSDDTINVTNSGFNSYVDGVKVVPEPIAGKIDGNFPLSGAVSSGMTFTGYTIWKVPQDWEVFQFSYLDASTGAESKQAFKILSTDVG